MPEASQAGQWASAAAEQSRSVSGIVVLTPSESKRLIGKGVAALPQVQAAMKRGRIIIANGSTNAFVIEEVLGIKLDKAAYLTGNISSGKFAITRADLRQNPFLLVDGKQVQMRMSELLAQFEAGDVFIKGANAVDPQGRVGILLAGNAAGTIGSVMGTLVARGSHLIVPVGLEKLVPDVLAASTKCGQKSLKYPAGATLGLMPLVTATVITEIQALQVLTGVTATHVASGGVGGSEGSVVLVVEGTEEQVNQAFRLVEAIKGEPPVPNPVGNVNYYGPDFPAGA